MPLLCWVILAGFGEILDSIQILEMYSTLLADHMLSLGLSSNSLSPGCPVVWLNKQVLPRGTRRNSSPAMAVPVQVILS